MSDVTRAVIAMPLDLAMASNLSQVQFHSQAQALLAEFDRLKAENDTLKAAAMGIRDVWREDQAQMESLRKDAERASYWRQRAKSAEGHLFKGDVTVAAKALHKCVRLAETPWDALDAEQRVRLQSAAFRVIAAVNNQREIRLPHDSWGSDQ